MVTHTVIDSPIGPLTLVGDGSALTAIYMQEHRHQPDAATFGARDPHGFEAATAQLAEYFAGERTEFELQLGPHGTEFQRAIWQLLTRIPYGETWSYLHLAEQYGDVLAIRAAAAANGRNPLSIVVPCHRVIGSDGSLTGYGGGLARKRFLLDLETPVERRAPALF
jgi:methylated-DNA-[protein]-cysteine S-methyltransferase